VRYVLHADLPANIESYHHEIGRAAAMACRPTR
jgi:superfamily II DNA helicase RecQ